jgi:uncharacterized protein YaeQ
MLSSPMAEAATIYSIETELSDVDRGVYQTLSLRMARQPSETLEFMLTRFLAYCLEYTEGIEFTEGVAAGDRPAVLVRDLTGAVTAWIEVGMPDAPRLHRGSKLAGRVSVYTHRNVSQVLDQLQGKQIHQAAAIPVYEFGRGFVEGVAAVMERRAHVTVSIIERHLYLDVGAHAFSAAIAEHHFS